MRFFLDTLTLTCKRLIRRPGVLFITLLLPIVCGIAGLYLAGDGEVARVRVGIGIEPGDNLSERLYAGLARFDGPIAFERHDLAERAYFEGEVAAGRMEAAYLIPPRFEESLRAGQVMSRVEVLTSPQSVMHTLAGEIVLASMLREVSPYVSRALLVEILDMTPEQAEEIVSRLHAYYSGQDDIFLEPVFAYLESGQVAGTPPLPTEARALHGVIALLLLAGVIWSLPPLIKEAPGILRKLPPGKSRVFALGTAFALALTGLLPGFLGLGAVALTFPAAISSLPVSVVMLLAYMLCLGLGGGVVMLLARRPDAVYPAGIFALILTAALGGPLVDLGEISPRLSVIPVVFPSSHYIAGALGGGALPLAMLLAFSLVFAGLIIFLARQR